MELTCMTSKYVEDAVRAIAGNYLRHGPAVGINLGFRDLDSVTLGLRSGELCIIAGRPASGKTSLVLSSVLKMATKEKKRVAFFELEMDGEQIATRLLSMLNETAAQRLMNGNITESELHRIINDSAKELAGSPLIIDDTPSISVAEIKERCIEYARMFGDLDAIVVDHLQLIRGSGVENRVNEVSQISRELKLMARELHVPVIVLSQLSRACESRSDKRPIASDLRDSGAIEQDADLILGLYREYMYDKKVSPYDAELIILKNRRGPCDTIQLSFDPGMTLFEDKEKPEPHPAAYILN